MAASSSLKTPARVACQTLRNRLRNINLADALPAQLVAKRSVTGLFCYSEDDANTKKRTVGADRFRVEWETLTGGELLDKCASQSSDYYYYTTTFKNDGADWWRGAIGGDVVDALPRKTSLWVGGNGSTTQAHYDVADNVLGQCLGTKRIRCWAPSSHWAMAPFPDAHPLARKAQIDIAEMPAPDLDVILEPGDALAIPAFWFHHCEARRPRPLFFSRRWRHRESGALGDDAAVLAPSSGEEPAPPRYRAGVASMAWRSTRRFSTRRLLDGAEVGAC